MSVNRLLFVVAFLLSGLSATAQDLAGCWRNVRNGYRPCYIQQDGNRLIFTNENGSLSEGALYGGGFVIAYEWGNLQGQLINGGNTLLWQGNGEWMRDWNCR